MFHCVEAINGVVWIDLWFGLTCGLKHTFVGRPSTPPRDVALVALCLANWTAPLLSSSVQEVMRD
jgi:hypothetical protein